MMLVEELNGMESAAVDVEMDIAAVKIRGAGFPHFYFRMQCFDSFPNCLSNTLTLHAYLHIKERQFTMMFGGIDGNDDTTQT